MPSFNARRIQAGRCCFQQQRGGRDRRLHTHPQLRGELQSTTVDDAHTSPSLLQSSISDGSVTSWDRLIFPTSKPMQSDSRLLDERAQFQSPAKIFAKLKASVSRNTGGMQTHEEDEFVLLTPWKGAANTRKAKWMTNETRTVEPIGAEAMAISPTKSPQHKPPKSFPLRTQYRVPSAVKDMRHAVIERNEYTPVRNPGQVSPQVPLSHKATHSTSSKYEFRTPAIGKQQKLSNYEIGERPRILEATVCLDKCPSMSPAKMFAYFKRRESKTALLLPQKTAHGKKDICTELSDDESQRFFTAQPMESDPCSIDEPTNRPVGNNVTDDFSPPARCPVVLNNLWLHESEKDLVSKRKISLENLVAPAKTHMQERKTQQPQEADYVRRSTREAGHRVLSRKRPASPDLKRVEVEYGTRMDAFDRLSEREDNRFQSEAMFESCRKEKPTPARKPLLVLAEDPLVNHSPCVSIPKKQKWKPAPLEPIQPKQLPVQKGSGCELAKWIIKFSREGLYVDGIRTSDNIPWHSTIIVERISSDMLRTFSGKTYTLIGPMNTEESSKFPKWLLSKFVHGFPPEWKMHVERFLSEAKKGAARSRATIFPQGLGHRGQGLEPRAKGPGPGATENAKKQSATPFITPSCPPPSSGLSSPALKRSRSGRLIKPPLEYWKERGMNVSMNVTILEDHYESSVGMTKSFTLPTISESKPPKQHDGLQRHCREAPRLGTGVPLVDQQQSSAVSMPKRQVRAVNRTRRARKTHEVPEVPACPPEGRSSSSPEEQEPGAGRAAERRRRPVREAALQAGPSTHRPDPIQRSNDAPSEGRIASLREQNIPGSNKPTSNSPAVSPSDDDIPVRRKGRRKARRRDTHQSVLYDSRSSTSLSSLDGSWTVLRKSTGKTVTRTEQGKGRVRSPELAPAPVSAPAQPSKRGGQRKVPAPVSAPAQPSKRGGQRKVPAPVSAPAQPSKRGGQRKVPTPVSAPAQPSKRGGQREVPAPVSAPAQPSKRGGQREVPAPVSAPAQPSKSGGGGRAPKRDILQEEQEQADWTEAELASLKMAMASFPKHMGSYWVNVAMMVGTRSPEDCQTQHNFQASVKASRKNARVSGKKKEPPADPAPPAITARVGSLLRKQQVWQFMEAMPKEDNDDFFSSGAMQGQRFQMPSMTPSGKEQGFVLSDLEPTTPRGSSYYTVKTPPGLHITPGMIRSVNRKKDDNYIYQLQKRMKRSQVNACKLSPPTKTFPLTPSVKRDMRKGGNMDDTSFVIREMFPDNQGAQDDESGEEKDVYFSDSD